MGIPGYNNISPSVSPAHTMKPFSDVGVLLTHLPNQTFLSLRAPKRSGILFIYIGTSIGVFCYTKTAECLFENCQFFGWWRFWDLCV